MVNIKRHPEIEVETPNENGDIKNETLISKIEKHIEENIKFFSLEFFPPRTPNGAINLVARFDRMSRGGPLFCDVTWHPAGDPSGDKETSSTTIASIAANYCGIETMLHMTCANTTQETVIKNLQKAKKLGLRNILALRGDPPIGEEWKACCEHLKYGADMVRLVRKVFGKYFTICVAGYPQGHPDCTSYEDDLRYLKDKVDAGADFIITQLFFDIRHYFKFVKDCRQIGIHCPIIPGILPIQSYASLRQLVKLSKLEIPQTILDVIEPIKNNDEAIRNYGVSLAVDICKQLLNSQDAPGLHIYTLNREVATIDILKALGLWKRYHVHRPLPWRHSAHTKRIKEDVRPIFWATRPKSYVHRTSMWDEYPNGRWGNSAAPSFSELSDHHLFYLRSHRNDEDRKKMWGEKLESIQDVYHVFQCYLGNRENKWGHKVKSLPFNDDELHAETSLLVDELRFINGHGFLTINSQPNVDAVRSDDERFGWGGAGGYIYQKAYLEFFMHKDHLDMLLEVLTDYPQVNYHIIDSQGVYDETNADRYSPIAVTWGVFPGKEIAQPTVVDPISFNFWKDEAFSLWTQQWQTLYDKNSKSYSILQSINDNFYLVNLVDNDFIKGNCLFDILRSVIEKEKLSEQDEHDNIEATNLNDDNLTTSDTINIRETLNDLAAASLSTSPILTNSPAVPS